MRNLPPPIRHWRYVRAAALFLITVYCFRFGIMYTPIIERQTPIPRALEVITALLPAGPHWEPVWLLGFVWVALGIAALAALVWPRLHNLACIGAAAFTAYWTLAYAMAPFTDRYNTPPAFGDRTISQDAYTAVFYLVVFGFLVYIGLTSRPAQPPVDDIDDEPDYGAYDLGEHRV